VNDKHQRETLVLNTDGSPPTELEFSPKDPKKMAIRQLQKSILGKEVKAKQREAEELQRLYVKTHPKPAEDFRQKYIKKKQLKRNDHGKEESYPPEESLSRIEPILSFSDS
jgi:hypothetical protein